jgi:alpha-L-fucosidase
MTDNELIARLLKWAEILNKEADMICAADRIEQLVRQRDGWEETALMYAQNVDFWKSKLAKAVEALMTAQEYIDDLESHEGAEGFSLSTKVLGDSYYAALAELEGDNV